MNAEIIAVGSELLTPEKIDTNSLWLTEQLNLLGVEVASKSIVGDDRGRLAAMISQALARSEIIILTGGLGPTEDDVTRDAVAQALGCGQQFRQELLDAIAERFARMKRPMAENNKRQANLIDGFEALNNPRGTAPGQWRTLEGPRVITLLPGPPREMKGMFTDECLPRLRAMLPPLHIATVHFRVAGMGESDLDQLISPVYTQYANPVTTILAGAGDISIHLRARGKTASEAQALVDEVGPKIEELLGDRIYSRDGSDLEAALGRMLRERNATVAVAESCTGGMVGQRITSVAGSSDYFLGGFLTYTDAMKSALAGVPAELIAEHTAVSEPVAIAMADGARAKTGATYAISVTGYAGPDAANLSTGVVFIGLATPNGTKARRLQFLGDRDRVRTLATNSALDWLRKTLVA
ncbi:MAG: competence/damage-inducible protein A [Bryobacteraceae bacterium]